MYGRQDTATYSVDNCEKHKAHLESKQPDLSKQYSYDAYVIRLFSEKGFDENFVGKFRDLFGYVEELTNDFEFANILEMILTNIKDSVPDAVNYLTVDNYANLENMAEYYKQHHRLPT
jgi:hypothetical protein